MLANVGHIFQSEYTRHASARVALVLTAYSKWCTAIPRSPFLTLGICAMQVCKTGPLKLITYTVFLSRCKEYNEGRPQKNEEATECPESAIRKSKYESWMRRTNCG